MLEILKFIFSDFWIWLGLLFMISVITYGFAEVIRAIRGK